MSIKSLKARLAKIPEPDLSRLRQEQLYDLLKPLPYDLREELRQRLREHRRQHEDHGVAAEQPTSTALKHQDLSFEILQKLREKLLADVAAKQQQEPQGETDAVPMPSKTSAVPPRSSAGVKHKSNQNPPPHPRPKG